MLIFFSLGIVLCCILTASASSRFLDCRGQRGDTGLLPYLWPAPSPFPLVLQYSLQEMLRKPGVMEFMKFKLCFNENVFSISASLGAWDWTVIVGAGWGLGPGWMEVAESALCGASRRHLAALGIQRLVCALWQLQEAFLYSAVQKAQAFSCWVWSGCRGLSDSDMLERNVMGEASAGGGLSPPLCSWSCSRCPLSVLQPIKGENYNGDSKAFGKTH